MGRTSVFVALAFLAGLGIDSFARGSRTSAAQKTESRAADLAAIAKLHAADIEATLTQDQKSLSLLWSDDAVNLQFPGPAVVGQKAMREAYEKFRTDNPNFTILKYAPDMKDIHISPDGWAMEWGYAESTFRISPNENPVSAKVKILRVLKRQSDGSWKFARIASNN